MQACVCSQLDVLVTRCVFRRRFCATVIPRSFGLCGGRGGRITRESGSPMGTPVDKISSPRAEAELLKTETLFLTTCNNNNNNNNNKYFILRAYYGGTAIPVEAWTGLESSKRLSLPDFKTNGTWWTTCTPQEIFLVPISVRG